MEIRYGAGGMPMVNQPKKVEPVEETAKPENKKQSKTGRRLYFPL